MGLHLDQEHTLGFSDNFSRSSSLFHEKLNKVKTHKPRMNIVFLLGSLGLNSRVHSRYVFARSDCGFVLLLPSIDCIQFLGQ